MLLSLLLWSLLLQSFPKALSDRDVDISTSKSKNKANDTLLSRRKRFIVFPDGSSFQLVFCTQNHGYLQVGDVVWFGQTAALAWELPSDPQIFHMFKDHKKELGAQRRKDDKKTIYYLNEDGRVIGKAPYRKKPIVNPAFAKRSVNNPETIDRGIMKTLTIKRMHSMQKNVTILKTLDEESIAFHRQGRRSIYSKFEKIFESFGYDGKECVLRMLCEAGKQKNQQGSFIDEIFRATFTYPSSKSNPGSHQSEEFDKAHSHPEDCANAYPECKYKRVHAQARH